MMGMELWLLAFSLGVARVTGTIYLPSPTALDVEVHSPPHITLPSQQDILYISEDFSASVHCKAVGNPHPLLKWRFNGNPIASYKSSVMHEYPNGTLVISKFDKSMEGSYQCLASNKHGVSLSQITEMTLRVFPKFRNEGDPTNIKIVAEGEGIKLECTEKPYGVPEGPFHWYHVSKERGNEQILVNLNDRMDIDLKGNLYIIDAIKEDTADTYACAMSSDNLVTVTIAKTPYVILKVTERRVQQLRPTPLGSTGNATANIGGEVTLECFFSGQPRPKIVWLYGDRNQPVVSGSENDRLTISRSGHKLTIRRVRNDDEGHYMCEATNSVDKAYANVYLNVTSRPLFSKHNPQLAVTPAGNNATFTCLAKGAFNEQPVSRPHWTLNGDMVPANKEKYHFSEDGQALTIIDVTKADMTCVQCNVTNSEGYAFGDGFLIVIDPLKIISRPNRTIEIKVRNTTTTNDQDEEDREVNITIQAASDICCPLSFSWTFNGEYLASSRLREPPFRYYQKSPNHATLTLQLSDDPKNDRKWMGEYHCILRHHAYAENATVMVTLKMKDIEEPMPETVKEAGFNLWWLALVAGLIVLIVAAIIVFLMVHFNYPRQAYLLEKEERKHNLDREKDILDHSFEEI